MEADNAQADHVELKTEPSIISKHDSFGADESSEGLVFGEVEEEETFSTPMTATRASSRITECSTPASAFHSPATSSPALDQEAAEASAPAPNEQSPAALQDAAHHAEAAAGEAPEAANAADQQQAGVGVDSQQSGASSLSASSAAAADALEAADHDPAVSAPAEPSTSNAAEQPDAASSPAENQSHLPAPAAEAASGGPSSTIESLPASSISTDAPATAAAGAGTAAAEQRSGLLSLRELSLNNSSSNNTAWAVGQQQQPYHLSSPSAASTSSSATAGPFAGSAHDSSQGGVADGEPQAVAVAAAAAATTSPWQQLSSTGLSPPHSPLSAGGSCSGLDRTASWQLQHAAAAAAGTAAHPAPPRSDIDLAKLSNTPASPHGESGWAAWQQRRRHFFVLTAAGKPVYSRHGDEQALAGFMAVIQALLSVVTDQGDLIHSITVGSSSLVFLLRGQLYLVAVSSRGEAQQALRRQLELLYQSIILVVTGGVERLLQRSPGYDVQQLLAGATNSMNALVSGYGDCPGWMMSSVEPAAAVGADRQAVAAALQEAVKACDCLYGVLLVGGRVLGVERGPGPPPLHVLDLMLLSNFTLSNPSLRHNETFVPVCLPHFQPNAFVHAYIKNLDDSSASEQQQQQPPPWQPPHPHDQQQQQQQQCSSTFLLLLSGSADAFHKLSAAQQGVVSALTSGPGAGVLDRVQTAARRPQGGRIRLEALPAPLGEA